MREAGFRPLSGKAPILALSGEAVKAPCLGQLDTKADEASSQLGFARGKWKVTARGPCGQVLDHREQWGLW